NIKEAKKELLSIKLPNLNKILKEESLGIMITNDLTEIEQQIYDLLIDGNSYEEVANVLQRKITTIKTHVAHIFDKKQVNSLQRLIVKHYKEKLSQYENTSNSTNNLDFNISLLNKLF
ncbi:LuxR C-terminal-related transcriptional regulator, partial [Candidatus Ruminimicrobiellum ovillum]|uniref:LuxR C-terminal-related transcriptional regulator n=1 Tax=Candidatus Ruminimicrobiellum ovillum TaxID=1947927 RepID=UPI003559CCD7